tara:strand:+ start:28262 stop:29428 length:1167 start_codon:yes stop_codon:yes gene_type:complete
MLSADIKSRIFINKLILTVLIITPIFTFQESLWLIFGEGGFFNYSKAITPVYVKGLKDLFFIAIILISMIHIIQNLSINRMAARILGFIFLLVILPGFYFSTDTLIFLSGLRWLMPFILIAFLINHIEKDFLYKVGSILFYLFILHFTLQIIQYFFAMNPYMRNPGIFIVPNTAAVFAVIVLFFSKFYMKADLEKKIYLLIPVSIFLTQSGTGIGIYVLFMVIFYIKRAVYKYVPIIIILITVILMLYLDDLSGRTGLVENSFGPRIAIFFNVLGFSVLLPEYFGHGTATSHLIANSYGIALETAMTDSWYAGIMINLGLLISFIIMTGVTYLFFKFLRDGDREKLLFLMIYLSFGVTSSISESYPANLLFAVIVAFYLKPKNINFMK